MSIAIESVPAVESVPAEAVPIERAPFPAVQRVQRVIDGIEELIGDTPMLRLPVEDAVPGVQLLAKLESANPLSSIKDRIALRMLRSAEEAGELNPGGTIIEATSGNTGISLAALAASRGYRCVIVMPDNATAERVALLRIFGAEVVLTPSALRFSGAIDRAGELHRATPGSWFARQHENPANVQAHLEATGPEIWADTGGLVDILVCGIGTGGTFSGVAGYLKRRNPGLRAVAVEPEGSPVLSRGRAGTHAIPGLNGGFVAETTRRDLIDEVLTVTDAEAMRAARWLARRAGVLAGISSGAAVHAPRRIARAAENSGKVIVTILPDTGERYLSVWDPGPTAAGPATDRSTTDGSATDGSTNGECS